MGSMEGTLAARLGKTVHVSPLRFRLAALCRCHPAAGALCIEDWLVDTANARGARVVVRPGLPQDEFDGPSRSELSDEELIVAICQLQCLDRPQMLRLAAQLVTRGPVDVDCLCLAARRERAGCILAELARLALHVEPDHAAWRAIAAAFRDERPPREPLLHWARLAQPVPVDGRVNAARWQLVA